MSDFARAESLTCLILSFFKASGWGIRFPEKKDWIS